MDIERKNLEKHLLEGYKITKISASPSNSTVFLQKGIEEIEVHSNSENFFSYIMHYKTVKKSHDNYEFIYIENLNEYYSKKPKELKIDQNSIKISGYVFDKGVITLHINLPAPQNNKGNAQFLIEIDKNPNFEKIDFKDEVEIYNKEGNTIIKGFVKEFSLSGNHCLLHIQDLSILLEDQKISLLELGGCKPENSFKFICDVIGFKLKTDISINKKIRAFKLISPVQNLIINENLKIGNVTFYQKHESTDDALIRKSDTGRNNPLWNGNYPRVRIDIEGKDFFEAIKNGYRKISQALDVVSFRMDYSFPKAGNEYIGYSRYKSMAEIKTPNLIYCRDTTSNEHLFFDFDLINDNALLLDLNPQVFFDEIELVFHGLITEENLNRKQRNLLQTLHWLRRAVQQGEKKDKLLDLWTAFEFLVSNVKIKKLFSEEERKAINENLKDLKLNDKQNKALNEKIDSLNAPPLLAKFDILISDLDITFSEYELEILKGARNKRNDLVHGKKDILVEDYEINKMKSIIEKILLGILIKG